MNRQVFAIRCSGYLPAELPEIAVVRGSATFSLGTAGPYRRQALFYARAWSLSKCGVQAWIHRHVIGSSLRKKLQAGAPACQRSDAPALGQQDGNCELRVL
jgi:hypothetical protein